MKCPKCGNNFSGYAEGLFRPDYSRIYCLGCQSRLELVNSGACHFISGIIFAGILVFSILKEFSPLWLWTIFSAVFCWLLNPLIVQLFGKWSLWSYRIEDEAKIKFLAAAQAVSTITAGVWVLYIAKTILLPYYELAADLNMFSERANEYVEQQRQFFSPVNIIILFIGMISVITAKTASYGRNQLRKSALDSKLEVNITSEENN